VRALRILLIEDNEGDIFLTTEAFAESDLISIVSVIRDGKAAIRFFENINNNGTNPDLISLDINLPKVNGHEVLIYLKNNEKYKHIPVMMLTTSSSEKDIIQSYSNHVNCYVTKPSDAYEFMKVVARIEDFWTNIVSISR
jgi:CheY-like chemotaxis protein